MKKYIKYFNVAVKTSFKSFSIYKIANLFNIGTQLLIIALQIFLWRALYSKTDVIRSYSFNDMILYIIYSSMIARVYPLGISSRYGEIIKKGEIASYLLKPIRVELQLLCESIGRSLYYFIYMTLPVLIVATLFFDINITLTNLLLSSSMIILSYIFLFFFELIIGSLAYKTHSLWGINNFKSSIIKLLSGKLIPLNFYPTILGNILKFIPFSAMYFLPINLLLNKEIKNLVYYIFSLIAGIVLATFIYTIVAKKMERNIMIQGG